MMTKNLKDVLEHSVPAIAKSIHQWQPRIPTRSRMMREAILVTLLLLATVLPVSAEQFKSTGTVDVYFSPNGGATAAVVRELDAARTEILRRTRSPANPLPRHSSMPRSVA